VPYLPHEGWTRKAERMRPRLLRFAFIVVCLASTGGARGQSSPLCSPWGPPGCFPPGESPQFFPSGIFGAGFGRATNAYAWYLHSMGERPLSEVSGSNGAEVYRLVVLPAFRSPIIVRLELSSTSAGELTVKLGETDRKPSPLLVDRRTEVSRANEDAFLRLLSAAEFWSMPPPLPRMRVFRMGGACWMLEAIRGGIYHAVNRGEPLSPTFRDAADFLLGNLGNINIDSLPRHFAEQETSRPQRTPP